MASSKNAFKRYLIYDKQLQGGKGKTKEQLMKAVKDETDKGISDRTFELDISNMRHDESLGYFAPIKYIRGKHYVYEKKNFTISDSRLTRTQMRNLKNAIKIFSQFKHLPLISHINQVVEQLEHVVFLNRNIRVTHDNPVIELEVPKQWPAADIMKELYQAISLKKRVKITYMPFRNTENDGARHVLKPLLIKEYQNRLYLIAIDTNGEIRTFGMERIQGLIQIEDKFTDTFDSEKYFKYALGITVPNHGEPEIIKLLFGKADADYVKTSRLHETQEIIREDQNGLLISIEVYKSEELIRMVRSYGSGVKVVSPPWLQELILNDAHAVVKGNLKN